MAASLMSDSPAASYRALDDEATLTAGRGSECAFAE